MNKKQWSAEKKEKIILEAGISGQKVKTMLKYGLCTETYYNWEKKYKEFGIKGLEPGHRRTQNRVTLKAEKQQLETEKTKLREELKCYKQMLDFLGKTNIPLKEREKIAQKYIDRKKLDKVKILRICGLKD